VNTERRPRLAIVATAALAILVALPTAGIASGAGPATASRHKHRHKYFTVRCDDAFRNVIDQTGLQLVAQYNAMGFNIGSPQDVTAGGGSSIDGTLTGEGCRYVGTRHLKGGVSTDVREGVGFMNDYLSEGEAPFPGETNPAIREYDWKWKEIVSRTKKGVRYGTISGINCTKASYDGGFSNPYNIQEYPC
jgi:hypothetical protein